MLKWMMGLLLLSPVRTLAQNPSGMVVQPETHVRDTASQLDVVEIAAKLFKIKPKTPDYRQKKKFYFSLVPGAASVPGGKGALVTATQMAFYMGDRHTTYISNITFSPSTNFNGQYSFPFHSNIWTNNNKWNLQGDLRYSYFPQYTWGMGTSKSDDEKLLVDYSYIRFYFTPLRRIKPYLFAGVGYSLDYHVDIQPDDDSTNFTEYTGYPYGTKNHSNSFSSGLTLNLLYDTRVNSINPLPGYYGNLMLRINPQFLGNTNGWSSVFLDLRKYIPFSKRQQNMLGIWTYYWTTLGSNPPYFDLPALGWDVYQRSGRGFDNRRYAGKKLWYLETEYRRQITANGLLGFVLFGNINSVGEPGSGSFSPLHGAAGGGLRIKFNKHSGTNICIDYAFSKDNSAFYFAIGEAF